MTPRSSNPSRLAVLFALLASAPLHPVVAQEESTPSSAQDVVNIDANEGSDANGRLSINIASGNENQQLNDALLAVGDIAVGRQIDSQAILTSPTGDRATRIEISDNAFSRNSGLMSINIAAGNQNQSANLALLVVGNTGVLSDQLLAQSRASIEPTGGSGGSAGAPNDEIVISDTAFGESSGLIQVNLIGGERNSSANTFSLNVLSAGDQP